MRLIIATRSNHDAAHSTEWGYKLRGRIWDALAGTEFDHRHRTDEPPGFVTSCPIPFGDVREGERRIVMISSPDERLVACLNDDIESDPTINTGEWSLDVESTHRRAVDVGEPASTGALETVTGVLVSFPPNKFDEYGITQHLTESQIESGQRSFWKREYGTGLFLDAIEANLDRKHRLFKPDHLAGPSDVPGQLFGSVELLKTFPTQWRLAQDTKHTLILSKWRLGYEVRDQDHRRHLNLALDCGIGERNPIGLGFVDPADRQVGSGL